MWTFDSALSNARRKIRYGKFKDALYVLRQLEKIDPNDSIIRFDIARCLINIEEFKEEGKQLLIELLDSDNRSYVMFELGKLELENGNKLEAWMYFDELATTTNNEYAILERGKIQLDQGDKEEAKKSFESLLDTNNKEYAILELGKIEISENNFDKALKYLNSIENTDRVLMEKIFLFIRAYKYDEAYEILKNNNFKLECDYKQLSQIRKFLEYKLGLIKKEELSDTYFYSQLFEYDENKTLEHIKLHLDENDNKRIHSTYEKFVNINIIYNDVKYKILDIKPVHCSIVDKYIVDYEYTIAEMNGMFTNKLEIVTISNTKDIITMYPIANIKESIKIKQKNKNEKI